MAYRCFACGKEIKQEQIKKRVRCLYCGSKIIYKDRVSVTKVIAR